MLVSPSLLAADFSNLGVELEKTKNADMLHIDIMDGVFVPNISIGIPIVQAIRPKTDLIFDTHLMIIHPIKYIKKFADAGADIITFHVECDDNISDTIQAVLDEGKKPGLSIKPSTSAETILPYGEKLHMVTIMTVEPGFGGQAMIESALEKIELIKKHFPHILIEVDGGVTRENAITCKNHGTDVLVAGTSVFGAQNPSAEIEYLKSL